MSDIAAAAEAIAAARQARVPLQALTGAAVPQSEAQGYRIQAVVHGLLEARLGARVGYKIGCTSPVMQHYLGISHPCRGGIFASGVHASEVVLRAADFIAVGVECEIAVRLGCDLPGEGSELTVAGVAQAIDCYLPAIEIVDNRYAHWPSLGAPTLVADDFFAAGCVLGQPVAHAALPDLLQVKGRAVINGVEAGQGSAADVLGHPHQALYWLADHLSGSGEGLRAGDLVLTGSLVQTAWLFAGDRAEMELAGLGAVAVRFA